MGDRLATIDMSRKEGSCYPTQAYLRTKWHLYPSNPLTTDIGRKLGAVPPLGESLCNTSGILMHDPVVWPQ